MLYKAFLVVKVYDYMEEKTESILRAKECVLEAFGGRDETAIKPAKEKKRLDCYGRKEYLRRMCDKDFAELPEDTREVFETIDPEVVEIEEATNKCYVYLTKDMYNRMELGAKMRMKDSALCAYLGIYHSKWKRLLKKYPLLRDRIDTWRECIVAAAAENLARDVMENKNVENSKWVLERLDRDNYGRKSEVNVGGEVVHKHKVDMEQLKELRSDMGKTFLTDRDEIGSDGDSDSDIVDIP
jgi:hypothetical protein